MTASQIMPKFHHNLMGIVPLCNHGCCILFKETAVTVLSKYNTVLLKVYRENFGAKLWRFSLRPNNTVLKQCPTSPVSLNANNIPSVGTIFRYLNTAEGFKTGNYAFWPGLVSANTSKYCPVPIELSKATSSSRNKESAPPRPQRRPNQRRHLTLPPIPKSSMSR